MKRLPYLLFAIFLLACTGEWAEFFQEGITEEGAVEGEESEAAAEEGSEE